MNSTLAVKLDHIPAGPGVYVYKDVSGVAIYVGKARSLRNRVRTYFQDSRDLDPRLSQMVACVRRGFVVTDTEGEALAAQPDQAA
jgi:excinuclease ABC subunit C